MRLLVFIVSIFLWHHVAIAQQSKAALEKQRKQIQQEIDQLTSSHHAIKKDKKESLAQLTRIQELIRKRDEIIETINRQMRLIERDISSNNKERQQLTLSLDSLKAQYAKTLTNTYKNRNRYDMLYFIVSAVSFNDAVNRVTYLKSYRAYRTTQLQELMDTQLQLEKKNQEFAENKMQKSKKLTEQNQQMEKLGEEKKEKDLMVARLLSKEKEITKQIMVKRKLQNKIKNAVASIIRREALAAKKESAKRILATTKKNTSAKTSTKKITTKPSNNPEPTPEVIRVSEGFENNRRNLPWPVVKGAIVGRFGTHRLEGMPIDENNIGIYIRTAIGESVQAVFEGTVSAVTNFGEATAITIRHGKYLTTYYNLAGISVQKGQQVKLGQLIGLVAESEDESNIGKMLFVITMAVGDKASFLDPEQWIKPKR